ncbi:IclR family transcriptional regulator [Amycolatopsis sp. CA-161197]|uniref:IclR family transcriptional regulator n=1 Tax=Amycolatopsis sp. CA-161197 TaxID=3239922 RepID=UPI003D94405C
MEGPAFANRERTGSAPQPPVQSLSKALDVLEAFSFERPELALGELSAAVGLPKSTVHKVARTLVDRGYLVQDPETRRYRLGLSTWHLGSVAIAPLDVRTAAAGHLRRLAADTGEQVTLWVLEHDLAICVDRVDSAHQVRTYTRLGTARDPLDLAAGRCLLAWQAGRSDGDARLRRIRERGYETTDADPATGRGVAAPIRDGHGAVTAATTVSGPTNRFGSAAVKRILPDLLAATGAISAALGHRAR